MKVNSYQSKVLKGRPYLASYGLEQPKLNPRAGTYKGPEFIKVKQECLHVQALAIVFRNI